MHHSRSRSPVGTGRSRYQRNFQALASTELVGDKITLPPSVLDDLTTRSVSYPLTFEMRNLTTKKSIHCGVREFVAAEETAIVPEALLHQLGLQDGDTFQLTNVRLPKGTHATFQVVSRQDQTQDLRAVLESSLRHFTTLTKDTCITLPSSHITLRVSHVTPSDAILISDVDLAVSIDDDTSTSTSPSTSTTTLTLNEPVEGSVAKGQYAYYQYRWESTTSTSTPPQLTFKLESIGPNSDADLFISTYPHPSITSFDHFSCHATLPDIITLSPSSQQLYYLAVYGYTPSTYQLSVNDNVEMKSGYSLSGGEVKDGVKCENCDQLIPSLSIDRHTLHCRRNIYRCTICHTPMPIKEKDKHINVIHTSHICECGVHIDGMVAYNIHKQKECGMRKITCIYCKLPFYAMEITDHESACGLRTEQCALCHTNIMLRDRQDHSLTEHGCEWQSITASANTTWTTMSEDDCTETTTTSASARPRTPTQQRRSPSIDEPMTIDPRILEQSAADVIRNRSREPSPTRIKTATTSHRTFARQAERERKEAERLAKMTSQTTTTTTPTTPTKKTTTKPPSTETIVRIQLPDGSTMTSTFPNTTSLFDIMSWILSSHPELVGHVLCNTYPPKLYTDEELTSLTLTSAKLTPSCGLRVKRMG